MSPVRLSVCNLAGHGAGSHGSGKRLRRQEKGSEHVTVSGSTPTCPAACILTLQLSVCDQVRENDHGSRRLRGQAGWVVTCKGPGKEPM